MSKINPFMMSLPFCIEKSVYLLNKMGWSNSPRDDLFKISDCVENFTGIARGGIDCREYISDSLSRLSMIYTTDNKVRSAVEINRARKGFKLLRSHFLETLENKYKFCWNCKSKNNLSVDHILPVSYFPEFSHHHDNLQLLCRSCNSSKGNNYIQDHRASTVFLHVANPEYSIFVFPFYPGEFKICKNKGPLRRYGEYRALRRRFFDGFKLSRFRKHGDIFYDYVPRQPIEIIHPRFNLHG